MSRFTASSWETQQPSATVCEVPAFTVCFAQPGDGSRKGVSNSLECRNQDLEYGSPGVWNSGITKGSSCGRAVNNGLAISQYLSHQQNLDHVSLVAQARYLVTDPPVTYYVLIVSDHHGASGNIACSIHHCCESHTRSE